MKYINKVNGQIIEPKTFAEEYVCLNNSDFELVVSKKTKGAKEPLEEATEEEAETEVKKSSKKNK